MREYSNKQCVTYDILDKDDNVIFKEKGYTCYSNLKVKGITSEAKYILFKDFRTKGFEEYTDKYLLYISKMLDLESTITPLTFKVKLYNNITANLIVATIVRMLFEGDAYKSIEKFLIKLLDNTYYKHEDKFSRFCYIYSTLNIKYMSEGHHICKPKDIKIKTIDNFKSLLDIKVKDGVTRVNNFFKIE